MAFVLLLIYLVLTFLRPQEQLAWLAPYRIMLGVGAVGALVSTIYIPITRTTFRSPQLLLLPVFALAVGISMVIGQGWIGGAVESMLDFAIVMITFYMVVVAVDSPAKLRIVMGVMSALVVVLVAQGVAAFYGGVNTEIFLMVDRSSPDETGNINEFERMRASGFMSDPNDFAQTIIMVLPFVGLAWRKRQPVRNLLFVMLPMAWLLLGLQLTRSRGAVISLFVLIVLALRSRVGAVTSIALAVIPVIVIAGVLVGGRGFSFDQSSSGRIEAWSQGLQLLRQSPVFGVGYGFFTDYHELTAHNSFVLCFSELGLFGYATWLALLIATFWELRRLMKIPVVTDEDRALIRYARAIQLSLAAFLTSSLFLSRTYVVTLYILIGLAVACAGIARARAKPLQSIDTVRLGSYVGAAGFASLMVIYIVVRLGR